MQYFSTELCKKLQDKGLESESGMYWCLDDHGTPYYELEESPIVAKWIKDGNIEAFIFQDLLTKDNAVRLWGEEIEETGLIEDFYQESEMSERQITYQELPKYQTKSYELLDLYQQSGLEAVEKYVMENL